MSITSPAGRNEQILALWAAGNSAGAIAKELGLTRNTVIGVVNRNRPDNDPPRRRGPQAKPSNPKTMGGVAAKASRAREKAKQAPEVKDRHDVSVTLEAKRLARLGPLPSVGTVAFVEQKPGQCKFPMWPLGPVLRSRRPWCAVSRSKRRGAPYCGAHSGVCRADRTGPKNTGYAI